MKKWFKILLVIAFFAVLSAVLFIILKTNNISSVSHLRETIKSSGKFALIIYTLIVSFLLVGLCFIPLLNTSLIILGITLFGPKLAFITNIIAIAISTSVLFFIGDKFGEHLVSKLIGRKNLEDTQLAIHNKSKFWLPFLFLIPGIPDEAICLVAGMTKIKYWYLLLVSLIYHTFEIGIFCFLGSDLINWSSLTLFDWILFINIILVDIYILIKLEKHISNK